MKKTTLLKLAIALIIPQLLLALFFSPLPVTAKPAPPVARIGDGFKLSPPQQQLNLAFSQTVVTQFGKPTVSNGETVTYTIRVVNLGGSTVSGLSIFDQLPAKALANVVAGQNCNGAGHTFTYDSKTIANLRGGSDITLQLLSTVNWSLPPLAPNQTCDVIMSARVQCQADGNSFNNQVILRSNINLVSSGVSLTAEVNNNAGSSAGFSNAPTWCSEDDGGTFDMDWGDFDGDGDADLALGSTFGTIVYQNRNARLEKYWETAGYTLGVKWVDVDNNGLPELVAVGESDSQHQATAPGVNYVYAYNPTANNFSKTNTFSSPFQLLRVVAGDFINGNGPDLVVSSTALNAQPCPVLLYANNGGGQFNGAAARCVSNQASAALAPVDYNRDGFLDLALGRFGAKEIILLQGDGTTPFTKTLVIAQSLPFPAYDLSWGDYDKDSFPDLAAAFPLQREARIYRNQAGTGFAAQPHVIRTDSFLTPRALQWGDFNKDGQLNLALFDQAPQIYDANFDHPVIEGVGGLTGNNVWRMRGADVDNDGNIDLSLTYQGGPALVFSAFAPNLKSTLTPVFNASTSDVAWGNKQNTAHDPLELFFGAESEGTVSPLKIFRDQNGTFTLDNTISTWGPNNLALGDVNGDNNLDIAFSFLRMIRIYRAGGTDWGWTTNLAQNITDLAWGDSVEDGNARPDLLVSVAGGPNVVFSNHSSANTVNLTPGWQTPQNDNTTSVAWGDFDNDVDLDFAVGNGHQANRIYRNDGFGGFELVWSSTALNDTRSIAWADYDADGDLDLFCGNYGQPNILYQNQSGGSQVTFVPVWQSTDAAKTTSVAWGDWNNDGKLDLAVGNDGEKDQIYVNNSLSTARFDLGWESSELQETVAVAWGDAGGDGDLDLAVAQNVETGSNGVYENNSTMPQHNSPPSFESDDPLYLTIEQPGQAAPAYFYGSAELLSGPVNVEYKLYGHQSVNITTVTYQFSRNGGGLWETATPAAGNTAPPAHPQPGGQAHTFLWDTIDDEVIGHNTVFRICVTYKAHTGNAQPTRACAASPPFRVRAITCHWPSQPRIKLETVNPEPGLPVQFRGDVNGSGSFWFTWNFGDVVVQSQTAQYTFPKSGYYPITLTVQSDPCPLAKPVRVVQSFQIGAASLVTGTGLVYLPIILKGEQQTGSTLETTGAVFSAFAAAGAPAQLVDLRGQSTQPGTYLSWPPGPAADGITHYHIYRSPHQGEQSFRRLATVPAAITTYTDVDSYCGAAYFVTAVNAAGESMPSRASYYSPACPGTITIID